MRLLRKFSMFGLALLLSVGVACTSSDTLTGPAVESAEQQPSEQFDLVGDLTGTLIGTIGTATDLLTCSPQPYASVTKTIGPAGGTIVVGSHRLAIPEGALLRSVQIRAEQMPGSTNSVRFTPEDLRFAKPALLTMSYHNCAVVLLRKKIVYTDENLRILEVLRSLDLLWKKIVTAPIDHFSRYALAY